TVLFLLVFLVFAGCLSQTETKPNVLVIGSPSQETLKILQENTNATVKSSTELENKPRDQLAQYQIAFLDQSNQQDKAVSADLAGALVDWVKKSGKLIIVKDSGIYAPGSSTPNGWDNFQGIIPVGCKRLIKEKEACISPATINAQIISQKRDHPLTKDFEKFPTSAEEKLTLTTFPVERIGTELAYIESDTGETYTAIVQNSKLIIGKVFYFNYDPGMTPQILTQALSR
ncbi:MAG: hypothetical protein Q7K42_05125, partial [Candidatus Diapherotrites archaeon]|nr:hypothetical protein [Candidatus Diapherotrites archaeon]